MAMARIRLGNERTTSMRRMRMLSLVPLKNPATAPIKVPMMMAIETVTMPMSSETREPWTTRLKVSRRFESRPIRCWVWSAGQPRRWMHGGAPRVPSRPRSSIEVLGGKGAMTSANSATSTRKPRMAKPMTAVRWRRTLRTVSRRSEAGLEGSRSDSACRAMSIALGSLTVVMTTGSGDQGPRTTRPRRG